MTNDPGFLRLEAKVDKLTDAVMRLVVIEERQTAQAERIGAVETKVAAAETAIVKVDRRVDQWVNRGIGVWLAAVSVFALVKFAAQFFK
jgi:uncharacterized protein with PhoU and TrkA domain